MAKAIILKNEVFSWHETSLVLQARTVPNENWRPVGLVQYKKLLVDQKNLKVV